MADSENSEPEDDPLRMIESLMGPLSELNPAQLAQMQPEEISELLGGKKLGEVIGKFQQDALALAAELAKQQGIDLDDLADEDDDDFEDEDPDYADAEIDDAFFIRPDGPDGLCDNFPGSEALWQAALELNPEERLQVSIEIKSPPVTRIEKIYYSTCHYRLIFDLFDTKVTFRDVTTPRQDYLSGKGWPAMLKLPRQSWPQLEPLWETVQVEQFNLREALRSNNHQRHARQDLVPLAKQALQAGLTG